MQDQGLLPIVYFYPCQALKGFKACEIEQGVTAAVFYKRRDLYQICLVTSKSRVCYQEEERVIEGNVLFFASPQATYSWENLSPMQSGYKCLFTEEFLRGHPRLMYFLQSPILGLGDFAVCPLSEAQNKCMATIFGQLLSAQNSDYLFKHKLIANCLHLLIHEALKMQPSENG